MKVCSHMLKFPYGCDYLEAIVTIPSWPSLPTRPDAQEEYNKEAIWASVHMHVTSEEEEEEDYESGEDSWQISHLMLCSDSSGV